MVGGNLAESGAHTAVGTPNILVADDDDGIRFAITDFLQAHGFDTSEASSCGEAVAALGSRAPDAVVLDFRMPDGDALDVLERVRALDLTIPIVILTGHGSIDLAVRAVKQGAANFLTKPIDLSSLMTVLQTAMDEQRRRDRKIAERRALRVPDPFAGNSPAIRALAEQAKRVVESSRPVLLLGETGSGKGTVAQWLHYHGPRADQALIPLNCAALADNLLESELFGHERGAFTGAVTTKPGLIEAAHEGTLLLDEVGDMSPGIQPKLLTVLEEQRFHRLGSLRERRVDVRLIAATHQDLRELCDRGVFRRDLYFRISTLPLEVPPLRARREDLPMLVDQMLGNLALELGHRELHVTPAALERMQAYAWPGNIRELRNVLERAVLLHGRDQIDVPSLCLDDDSAAAPQADVSMTLADVERAHIESVLAAHDGQVAEAAAALGIPRSTLYARLRKYSSA